MSATAATPFSDLIAGRTPVAMHRSWPRHELDPETWCEAGRTLAAGGGELMALWGDDAQVHMAVRAIDLATPCVLSVTVSDGRFPSIGRLHAPAIRFERAVRDLYGHVPVDAHDTRHWLDHGQWGVTAPLGAAATADRRGPADYAFQPVVGEGLHQIPVGPVHAGIIEPGHFRFTANGETVARLEQRLGYVHKGIDALLAGADLQRAARLAGRISGDSTVAYSFAFARAVEAALGTVPPPRAVVLRGVMAELERVANHIGDIGAICNDAAFALIHAHCGILRERVLAACGNVFGHRLMMDGVVPGGVSVNVTRAGSEEILAALDAITPTFAKIVQLYDATPSLQDRTCGTGTVTADLVRSWAAGGFVGRAAGRDFDARRDLAYAPYEGVSFAVPTLQAGDVDARVWVRIREVEAAMALLRRWLADLPDGPIAVALPAEADVSEGVAVVEAFRGDVLVWLRIGAGRVLRGYARDASWLQWPLLEAAIRDNIVADFPLCNKSFNCSYSGHDL